MQRLCILFIVILIFGASTVQAQAIPPIQNFTTNQYKAENQNWSISQSKDKYIYVANNEGLLEYNGAKWRLYPSPNDTFIRAVNVIGDYIYTGCFREFGYWNRNEVGDLTYQSLIPLLKEPLHEDEHIWNILSFDKWILFQSLHRIYIFNTVDNSFNIIKSKTQLPKVFVVDSSIYFQKMEQGLFKIENGLPKLISDATVFKEMILVNIFKKDKKLLLQTQVDGFYFMDGESVEKWNLPLDARIPQVSVFSSLRLKNGNFALGTISNGILILNENGELLTSINKKMGINNNTVLSMYEDVEQNLWLGLDNGISMVNFNSPFSVYTDPDGELGSVYAAVLYEDDLYLGTNQGLFYRKDKSDEFKFIEGTKGQVWCLKVFDDTLFCGHNLGTFVVKDGVADLIVDAMGTWDILEIPGQKDMLLQGHYNGLNTIEKINNQWQYRSEVDGFDISSRYFGFDSDLNVFVNHEWKGVFKLELDRTYKNVIKYTTEESSPKGLRSSLITYNNRLLYTTENGVSRYNDQKEIFVNDPLISVNLFAHDNYVTGKLIADPKMNRLWGFTDKNVVYFEPARLNADLRAIKISLPSSLRGFLTGYESIAHMRDQIYLFGTTQGYLLLDLSVIQDKSYNVTINSTHKSSIDGNKIAINTNVENEFKYVENNLYFSYSVAEYDNFDEINYQYQLEGIYEDWSDWSTSPEISFNNLPFGSYTFNVRARGGNKTSENIASYNFEINRPWILSNTMILIYSILFVGLLFVFHLFNKRYYTKEKHRLLEKKQRVFALSQLENEREIMKLKNENLKNEVGSKSRELAALTLGMIKKNELLGKIKNELKELQDDSSVNSVVKIINKNINKKSDWKFFQEAFNNTDRDFLKKIKELHPTLTPNDLRLCAYLRMNLTSKEIAPLLHISNRSVEIKRYRLRKKIDLAHEKSLVEYILSI